jgi:hypothetical protein
VCSSATLLCLDHAQGLLPDCSASGAYKSMPSSHQSVFQAPDPAILSAWPGQHMRINCQESTHLDDLSKCQCYENFGCQDIVTMLPLLRGYSLSSTILIESHRQAELSAHATSAILPQIPRVLGKYYSRGSHGYYLASPKLRERKCLFPLGDEHTPADKNFFPARYASRMSI